MADSDTPKPSKTYTGSCQCGAVSFEATISPPLEDGHEVTNCNCSICTRNGYYFVYAPKSGVGFKSGEDVMKSYKFYKERIAHQFCPTCGTSVCAISVDPNFYPDIWALNVRTFQGIDLDKLSLKKVDGKSM